MKMTLATWPFMVTVLTTLQITSCIKSASKDCDPKFFPIKDDSSIATCNMLYQKMERALVTELNMYKLRHVMFPNFRAEPLVVDVSYNITASQISNSCPGAESDEDMLIDFPFQISLSWTSSVTLSFIDPKDLDFFQPAALALGNPITRDYRKDFNENLVFLDLAIGNLTCMPSEKQVIGMLSDLTSKIKGYAANTGQNHNIDSWDTAYKGYVVQTLRWEFLYVLGPAISLVIIFTTCAYPVLYKKLYIPIYIKSKEDKFERDPYAYLFLSVTGIITVTNVFCYLVDVVCFGVIIYDQVKLGLFVRYGKTEITRFILLQLSYFLCFIAASIIQSWKRTLLADSYKETTNGLINSESKGASSDNQSKSDKEDVDTNLKVKDNLVDGEPLPGVCCFCKNHCLYARVVEDTPMEKVQTYLNTISEKNIVCCIFGCCKFTCFCCDWKNMIEMLTTFTYLAFLCLAAWSIVPTVTLAFVNPLFTLAIVSFLIVFFALSAILFALLFVLRDRKKKKWRKAVFVKLKSKKETKKSDNGSLDPTKNQQEDLKVTCCDKVWRRRCMAYTLCWDFFWILALAIILFLFGTSVVLVIYARSLNIGPRNFDQASVGTIVAFVPTIITGGVAWLAKQVLFSKREQESDSQS